MTTRSIAAKEVDDIRISLRKIIDSLHRAPDLAAAEDALDGVSTLLDMRLPYWAQDISNPYYCRHMDAFTRARGWPDELLQLWWSRHAALKMPLYIRCRFEHLPFVAKLDMPQRNGRTGRISAQQARITEIVKEIGVKTMLTVPLHLSKGQVAMIGWAGNRDADELNDLLRSIGGDLLGIGHHFMRIASLSLSGPAAVPYERSCLTPREWDCLRTLAQGYRESEVAELAGISKVTVRFHLDNVINKFGLKTRTQAVALAAQLGLLGPIGN